MRPTKLTMSAFGPYKGVETIDFETINDQNIFLISGPTGAGKTTIFDAISYALYGGASGSNREHDGFRSDFANENVLTYVEMEFLFRDEHYVIKRVPKQMKKKVRGDGYTEQNSDAELWLPNGQKPITGVSNVNDKVQSMFGITYSQFKQIVMLPQGEFRKLLDSKSNEREEIFRKIFGTELYNLIQNNLNDRSRELRNKLETNNQEIMINLKHTNHGNNERVQALQNKANINQEELLEEVRFLMLDDLAERRILEDQIFRNGKKLDEINETIIKAQEIEGKIKKKKELETEVMTLKQNLETINALEQKVVLAEKALRIRPLEQHKEDAKESVNKLEHTLKQEKTALSELNSLLEEAKAKLKEAEELEPRQRELNKTIPMLNQMTAKFKVLDELMATIETLEGSFKTIDADYTELTETIQTTKTKQEDYLQQLEAFEQVDEQLIRYTNERNALYGVHERLKKLVKAHDLHSKLTFKHKKLKDTYELLLAEFKEQNQQYEASEEQFKRGQAGILAETLETGSPCPVCGSHEHPNRAEKPDTVPSEDELKQLKELVEARRSERDASYEQVHGTNIQLKEKEELINSLITELKQENELEKVGLESDEFGKIVQEQSTHYEKMLQDLHVKIEDCDKKKIKKESIKRELNDVKGLLRELEIKQKEKEQQRNKINEELKSEQTRYKQIKSDLPDKYETLQILEGEIKALTDELTALEAKREDANEIYQNLTVSVSSKQSIVQEKERNLSEARREFEKRTQTFESEIEASSFETIESYKTAMLNDEVIKTYKQDIKDYYETKRSKEDYLKQLRTELKDHQSSDIEVLKQTKTTLEDEKQTLTKQEKTIHTRIETNTGVIKSVEQLLDTKKEIDQSYSLISELATLANGKNRERLTFERYVLAAYFDEIIHAANIRLAKMTASRYVLKRIEERGKGNAQQGLDLEVLDNYTGKTRPVKTLSGGESFKASLSLALGLADIVQSYAGGISLDTIFIDEGFGSLDPESLDQAIGTLVSLEQSGRLVGVISHVSELKERINAKLLIRREQDGSSKAAFNI
ncbi:Exonuclease SbcC protein [Haloplasma contractile SSD-17B]|uniref:Nuclease SbcCD subunit C n=2 Tax=Haloplasma TaxID=471824 RepID=U2FIY0_9MOLU|nr:Exonuclease SbcC protein [Haloplasma contractile SSD-17B]